MRKYLAEFIGTFVLTFTACGAVTFTGGYQGYLGITGIALIFGTVFIAMSYSIGNVSGCHVNPAVSIAMFASGRMKVLDFIGYVVAQMLGGIAGAFSVYGVSKSFNESTLESYSSYGIDFSNPVANGFDKQSALLQIKPWGAVLVEIILSFIFVITFLGVTAKEKYKSIAGIVIGMSLTAVHLFGVLLTGTGVNPARSFGPALVNLVTGDSTAMSQVWVFLFAPLVGGLLAAAIYMLLTYDSAKESVGGEITEVDSSIEENENSNEKDTQEDNKDKKKEESEEVENITLDEIDE